MHTRRMLRALPVVVLTFFIILFVDFRMRTKPSHRSDGIRSPNHLQHPTPEAASPAKDAANSKSFLFPRADVITLNRRVTDLHEEILKTNNNLKTWRQTTVPLPPLKLTDIFIAVKTTGRFHSTRLGLLMDTWISRTKDHVSV